MDTSTAPRIDAPGAAELQGQAAVVPASTPTTADTALSDGMPPAVVELTLADLVGEASDEDDDTEMSDGPEATAVIPTTPTQKSAGIVVEDEDSRADDEGGDDDDQDDASSEAPTAVVDMDEDADDETGLDKGFMKPEDCRTRNELATVELPEVSLTAIPDNTPMTLLGHITSIVGTAVVLNSDPDVATTFTREGRTLDIGTPLALENRRVIGGLFESLGNVQRPLFAIRFARPEDIAAIPEIILGAAVYYASDQATWTTFEQLRAIKGCDASNLYDEELGGDYLEFSDDEEEMKVKALRKQQAKEKRLREQGLRPPPTKVAATPRVPQVLDPANPFGDAHTLQSAVRLAPRVVSYDDVCFSDGSFGRPAPPPQHPFLPAPIHQAYPQPPAPQPYWQPTTHQPFSAPPAAPQPFAPPPAPQHYWPPRPNTATAPPAYPPHHGAPEASLAPSAAPANPYLAFLNATKSAPNQPPRPEQ
ncbi:hypothetical protein IWQ60_002602 [Tieghemiomyces parasiticus]|uniref:H/ACA ribonucleoprotein complex non-core subunit NAF1 n=1 Tax=Tieghemiomyces parasiticus TaxID=78921 RepID=A0A9W8E0U9_9FUNG|nr:hypothetical protein IWQ60_002602 [Tieghemiomyces parasiticus]